MSQIGELILLAGVVGALFLIFAGIREKYPGYTVFAGLLILVGEISID